MVSNKRVLFTKISDDGLPVAGEHMKVQESTIDLDSELPKGDFILKTLEISIDPYMAVRMCDAEHESYAPAFVLNEPMADDTMSVVVKSNNPDYKVGDLVYGRTSLGRFEEYVQVSAEYAKDAYIVRNDAKENGLPLFHYVGSLAMSGLTAYYGLVEVGKPKKGETLYVSAASGNVGQLVGQFGKALGLRVVGSAGSAEKVEYLKSSGFDDAFNYKDGDIEANLRKHCPNGIDIYFDAIGGKMLDAVLAVANRNARIVACGMSSQYSLPEPDRLLNIMNIIVKSIKLEGYFVFDHLDYEEKFLNEVTPLLISDGVKYRLEVSNGIDQVPDALIKAFKGEKLGKQVVHVADL